MPFGPSVALGAPHIMPEPVEPSESAEDADSCGESDAPLAALSSSADPTGAAAPPFHAAMKLLHSLNAGADVWAPVDALYTIILAVREITRQAEAHAEEHREEERREKERAAEAAAAAAAGSNEGASAPTSSSSSSSCSATDPAAPADSSSSSSPSPSSSVSSHSLHADNLFPLVLYVVVQSGVLRWHFVLGHLSRFLPAALRCFGTSGFSLSLVEGAVAHVCDMERKDVVGGMASGTPTAAAAGSGKKKSGGTSSPHAASPASFRSPTAALPRRSLSTSTGSSATPPLLLPPPPSS